MAIIYTVSPEERQDNERHIVGGNQKPPSYFHVRWVSKDAPPCGFLWDNAFPLCGPLTIVYVFPPLRNCV